MSVEVKAPAFPESVSEGGIAAWHKKVGDAVKAGELLVEIETDKVVMEVQATVDGVLKSCSKKVGDSVKSQEVIGSIEAGAVATQSAPKAEAPAQAPVKDAGKSAADNAGPGARRHLAEAGLAATEVKGSGKDGRVTTSDVQAHVEGKSAPAQKSESLPKGPRSEERVPMTRLRKTVANRLLEVSQTTAMLTTFNEVDMKAVMDLRQQYKDVFEKKHGVRLGFMSFFTKAAVEALKQFPAVNASIDGDDIVYHAYYDVGIAVSSPRGLVVPIVRNAEQLSLADIEIQIRDLALKARDGKLTLEEMRGGTFSITNGGIFGSMLSTPILNAPQSAILGMHNIVERPVAIQGKVEIRPIMYLALSYDHRIIDGRESVSFLKTIKDLLEDPSRLLLQV